MRVHEEGLADVERYIAMKKDLTLADMEPMFQSYMRIIERFKSVDAKTSMLEIGIGTGWFPLMCKAKGLRCRGLEVSPQLVEYARQFARGYQVEPDLEVGNIEESDIGDSEYDVIVASSVFEHVEHWERALGRVYKALRPGGMFFFSSTSKFSFVSGEYNFPLYGWLPDRWRYKLRVMRQGPDIMKLGIDFNQFTYPGLRRAFRKAGFSQAFDRVDLAAPSAVWKRGLVTMCRVLRPLKEVVLTFSDATMFVCVK